MTKAPTPTEKSKTQRRDHKNASKNFDYTVIEDPLRTVSWSNNSQPTSVVKPVNGIPTFPHTTTVQCVIKGTNMQILFYCELKVENILPIK